MQLAKSATKRTTLLTKPEARGAVLDLNKWCGRRWWRDIGRCGKSMPSDEVGCGTEARICGSGWNIDSLCHQSRNIHVDTGVAISMSLRSTHNRRK